MGHRDTTSTGASTPSTRPGFERGPDAPPRLTIHGALNEIADEAFSFDHGLLHTFLSLCRAPGHTLRRWVVQRDRRLTRPFRYFLILVTLALLLEWALAPDALPGTDSARPDSVSQPVATTPLVESSPVAERPSTPHAAGLRAGETIGRMAQTLIVEHRQWLFLLIVPFLALGMQSAFRHLDIDLAEHWAAVTYAFAHAYFLSYVAEALLSLAFTPPMWVPVGLFFLILHGMLVAFPQPWQVKHHARMFGALVFGTLVFLLMVIAATVIYFAIERMT